MTEQVVQQRVKAEITAPVSRDTGPVDFDRKVGENGGCCEHSNPSLPDLAVAAVRACDSPTFLNAKARVLQEKQSGAMARVKKLGHLAPITVPKRAIGGDFARTPSSGSPTPSDFSPMLLPRAEANLTAWISEHNKQQRQLQMQLQLQQQIACQQVLQAQPPAQQLKHAYETSSDESGSAGEQSPAKRPKLKRGRKRQRESLSSGIASSTGTDVQPVTVPGVGTVVCGRTTAKRSSLGTMSLTVEEAGAGGAAGVPAMRKGPWLPEEDSKLLELVEQFGAYDWSFIADHIPGRVGKQCRERYFNHLAPDVRKDAWTDQEDDAIVHAHHVVGNKWTNIAKMLGNGRSPNSIKNRWHSSLKNRLAEHGGETSVMETTGAALGCKCDCKRCDCSCKVACVAFGCQCCSSAHKLSSTEAADDAPVVSNSTGIGTDDEYATADSTSSSVSTTPASTTASAPGCPSAVVFSAPGSKSSV